MTSRTFPPGHAGPGSTQTRAGLGLGPPSASALFFLTSALILSRRSRMAEAESKSGSSLNGTDPHMWHGRRAVFSDRMNRVLQARHIMANLVIFEGEQGPRRLYHFDPGVQFGFS